MKLNWRTPPETFMDKVELGRVEKAMALLKFDVGTAIDSYEMTPDGPALSSVFILTGGYIFEVNMVSAHLEFDVANAARLANYRISFGEQAATADAASVLAGASSSVELPGASERGSESAKSTQFVVVTLRHSDEMASRFSYFGEDLDAWLEYVLSAYPKEGLLN